MTDEPPRDVWAEMEEALARAAIAITAAKQLVHDRSDERTHDDQHPRR